MMKDSTEGTVTTTKSVSSGSMENQWNDGHSNHALPRAESNTAARKRRMTEQPTSKTPKTARRHEMDIDNSRVWNKTVLTHGTRNYVKSDCNVASSKNHTNHLDQLPMVVSDDYVGFDNDLNNGKNRKHCRLSEKPPHHPDVSRKLNVTNMNRRNDSARLRKTIQWLVEGSTKLRENIAEVRRELHEEKKNSSMARREIEIAVREAKTQEASKYQKIIADLKVRLSHTSPRSMTDNSMNTKVELSKDENYKRELAAMKKRLAEANETIRKLKLNSSYSDPDSAMKKPKSVQNGQLQQIKCEAGNLRQANEGLEEKLQMKKLRDSERGHGIHLAPGIKVKIPQVENAMDLCNSECEAVGEVIRLRELAVEQQEMIEYLHQVLKERERKLDQLSNKRRKEEFYKQWLELEPVAEVIDEDEHEEGDSGLSTAPSSLSLQAGGWQANGVTREAYEALLLEVDELHTQYAEEQQELAHAKSQVRDLEKALLQETRGSQNSRRALSAKLSEAEEREGCLLAEISELREQNELLEFRVLELEESEPRESPDTADSGVVSPEPSPQLFKDHGNIKQRDRAIATVIPYCNNPSSPIPVQKSPLSLQESGIFDDDDEHDIVLATCGTQTDTPAGELLQEVQRLQELRERIQERASKVPSTPVDTYETVDDNRLSLYKQKIHELEERLDKFAMAEQKRSDDELIAKQREEDLLDENYRLTENVYWLENELRKYNDTRKFTDIGTVTNNPHVRDSFSMTDDTISKFEEDCTFTIIPSLSRCQKIIRDVLDVFQILNSSSNSIILNQYGILTQPCPNSNVLRANYNEKIQLLSEAECCLRREMINLGHNNSAFTEVLRQNNGKTSQLEIDQRVNLDSERESSGKTAVNRTLTITISDTGNSTENQSPCDNSVSRDEVDHIYNASEKGFLNFSRAVQNSCGTDESANVYDADNCNQKGSNHNERNKLECVLDNSGKLLTEFAGDARGENEGKQQRNVEVSSVRIHHAENITDNCVKTNRFDAKEKVRKQRRNYGRDRDGWAPRAWRTSNCTKNRVKSTVDLRRLVLYPEICV